LEGILKQWYPVFPNYPLLKRNKDADTIPRTFHLRNETQMIDTLAKQLLDSPHVWAARDVIMSDFVEIFESEEILTSFFSFFEDD
jgi:hypothetical protein